MKCLCLSLLIFVLRASSTFSQSTLIPTSSFLGTNSYERVGYHLHTAGDVNGDGYDDFMIGAFHHSSNGYNCGAVYLFLGKQNGSWGHDISLNNADARLLGATAYESAGYFIGGAGDVNGDGLEDMVIGASEGFLYVVLGRASANWGQDFVLYDQANARYEEEFDGDQAGLSCAIIGDLNNDGFDDIIVGAPYSNYATDWGGKAYIILGKSSGWQRGVNLSTAEASFYGSYYGGLVGYCVDGVGDVNGDGIPDFAIGARGEGRVFLFFGKRSVNWGKNFDINMADVIFSSEQYGNYTGWRVSGVGDVNGDNFDDFIVSAPYHDENEVENGKVYLILGRSSGWETNLSQADASYFGEAEDDEVGWDAQGAGDVDGDGYADFLIGGWYNDANGTDAGKTYLIRGKPSGWQKNVHLSAIPDYFLGENPGDYVGHSCAGAGDVNGDGLQDIITSATYYSEAYYWGGKIYLFVSENGNPPTFQVSGSVLYYAESHPVSDANVALTHIDGTNNDLTDSDGRYGFFDIKNGTVSLVTSKDNDHREAISGSDALLVLQYLAFLAELNLDQQFAADVTEDGAVSGSDAQAILRYLAFYTDNIGATGQWRFDPPDTSFNLATNSAANFKGFLLGDANGNWGERSNGLNIMSRMTMPSEVFLFVSDKIYFDGDEVRVPVLVENVQCPLQTFIFTIAYDQQSLEFESVSKTSLSENFMMVSNSKEAGQIHIAMAGVNGVKNDGSILECIFKLKSNPRQPEHSPIEITRAFINDKKIDLKPYYSTSIVETNNESNARPAESADNYPNPFNSATTISFTLHDDAFVSVNIFNTLGQRVKSIYEGAMTDGRQRFEWNSFDDAGRRLPSGIYFYQLRIQYVNGQFNQSPVIVTKKMVLIE